MTKLRKEWLIALIVGVILLVLTIVMVFLNKDQLIFSQKNQSAITNNDLSGKDPEYTYAFETCYVGDPYLSEKLFRIPFQKTDSYICNNQLLEKMETKDIDGFVSKSQENAKTLFNVSYKDIPAKADYSEIFTNGFHLYFDHSDNEATDNMETVTMINGWYTESKTSLEARLNTDKCMVYYDENSIIVRGQLIFTVYETEDLEAIQDAFDIPDLQLGDEVSAILEMYYIPGIDRNDYDSYTLSKGVVLSQIQS